VSANRPRSECDACYEGVCCYCRRGHLDKSCCSHDACQVRSPVGGYCLKRYDHPGEHEAASGIKWTAPDPDLYQFPEEPAEGESEERGE